MGKLLGALFGYALAKYPGLILGLIIGHFFDMRLKVAMRVGAGATHISANFFKATFQVMGHLSKIDGRVSEREIQAAKEVMRQLNLNDEMRMQAIDHFTQGKQPDFDLIESIAPLKSVLPWNAQLRQIFLEILLYVVYVDGIHPAKQQVLETICHELNIPLAVLKSMQSRFQAEQQFAHTSSQDELKNAYGVLGVSSQASQKEVKRAYRKLMSEHHPDKLAAKGLPEQMRAIAKEKTQSIQRAWEIISKHHQWR